MFAFVCFSSIAVPAAQEFYSSQLQVDVVCVCNCKIYTQCAAMQLECGSQPTLARASTHPTGGSSSKAVAEQGSGFQTPSRSSSAAFARADRRGFDSVTRLSESHVEYYAKSGLTVSLRKGLLTDIKV